MPRTYRRQPDAPAEIQQARAVELAASLPALPEQGAPQYGPLARRQQGAEPPPEWDTLSDDARELVAHSISPNTRAQYGRRLRQLDEAIGRHPTDKELADFLASEYVRGMAPASIETFLAAYAFRARIFNQPPPGPMARRTMSGITRAGKARGRGQVKGMRWEDVDAAIAASLKDDPSPRGHRDRALLALMSDALLRVSEAAAVTWGDVEYLPNKGARLTIAHSKTDQEGKGVKLYVRQRTVDLLADWAYAYSLFARKQIPACLYDDSIIFPRMNRNAVIPHREGQPVPLNPEACRFIIKKMARRIGLKGVSGHSLRVGGAMSLAERGVDLVRMQLAGRWSKPDLPAHYAQGIQDSVMQEFDTA